MAHFEALPTDLTLEITSYLATPELKALCLTSKACQIIAEPALYSTYHQPIIKKKEEWAMPDWQSVLPFLHIIAQREVGQGTRHLGQYCRSVSISGWSDPYEDLDHGDRVEITRDCSIVLLNAALQRGLITTKSVLGKGEVSHVEKRFYMRLIRELRAWTPDALVVLLLSLLPNLARLEIRDHETFRARLRWDWLCQIGALHNLRVLETYGASIEPREPIYDLNAFKPALTLPNLRILKASLCRAKSLALGKDSCYLEEISIESGEFGASAIASLITACRRLRKLAYSAWATSRCDKTSFTIADMMKSLRKHKDCLTDLDVAAHGEDGDRQRW